MAVLQMDQLDLNGGLDYYKKITLVDAQNSDIYLLPARNIEAIAFSFTGAPVLYCTISSVVDIQNGVADWIAVPSGGVVTPLATAVKATNASGTAVINFKVRCK